MTLEYLLVAHPIDHRHSKVRRALLSQEDYPDFFFINDASCTHDSGKIAVIVRCTSQKDASSKSNIARTISETGFNTIVNTTIQVSS
jgi:hypothetical protein